MLGRVLRDALTPIVRSNALLFTLSVVIGFLVGSGCILSSDRDLGVPRDFHIVVASTSRSSPGAGRLTIDALGRMRFEDWAAPGSSTRVVEELWDRARVDSVYAVFRENGFISLRQRYPAGEDGELLDADEKVTIEGVMRGTYQVVQVVGPDGPELPGSVRNILDWYSREIDHLRGKTAAAGG